MGRTRTWNREAREDEESEFRRGGRGTDARGGGVRRGVAGVRAGAGPGLLLLGALALGACRADEPVRTAGSELLGLGADQVLIGMEHFMTREGLRRAHVQADTAFFFQDSSKVRLRPVDVVFFDTQGGELSHLTAAEGVYDLRTNDMEVRGRVVMLSRREFQRLETEHLRYDSREDKIRGDVDFVLYRENTVIRGTGLVSDPGLESTRVTRPSAVVENPPAGSGAP